MATTISKPKERLDRHAERIAALEREIYGKRTDAAYFDFWNEATWIVVAAILGMAIALSLIVWIKG